MTYDRAFSRFVEPTLTGVAGYTVVVDAENYGVFYSAVIFEILGEF